MTKDRFKLIPAVYVIVRHPDGHVLLGRRAGTGYQDGKYGLPAGHVDGDELATVAAARELLEETTLHVNPADLRFVHLLHRLSRDQVGQERLDIFFEADIWQGQPAIGEPDKCDSLEWFSPDALPDDIIPLVRGVLQHIENGVPYSELLTEPL